ncbi:MAG: adenylate/guanylate cyclase domain-containing protein [Geminicoccaceae bacterium]
MDRIFQSATESAEIVWGEVIWSDHLQQPTLSARVALRTRGAVHAVLVGAVTLSAFREHVAEIGKEFGQTVYVLEGRDRIVADSMLSPGGLNAETGQDALPTLAEGGDPVLLATRSPSRALDLTEGQEVQVDGSDYAVFSREIEGFTRLPWSVGTYLPMSQAGAPVFRILRAGALAIVLGLIGTALTAYIGYRLTRPVARLAQAADRVTALQLEGAPPLPASSIREIDAASQAFNAMTAALRWFEVYVPKRLVRSLMSEETAGVVSRESVLTVMFTDLRGFSTMSQDMNAADAAALLNRHFELIEGCVAATEGTLDKYLGDGTLVFWGAPQPQADHARRACDAALAIRAAVERDNAVNTPALAVRIGIHTGPVLVGNIGTRDRVDYTIVGDTVNVAQRLQELGKALQPEADVAIIVSGATAAAIGTNAGLQSMGEQTIRGHTEPMAVYAL